MQTTKEMKQAIEAFERDGKVQCRSYGIGKCIVTTYPVWDFLNYTYSPVPKPKVIWVNEYEAVVHASRSHKGALRNILPGATRKAVRYVEADLQ